MARWHLLWLCLAGLLTLSWCERTLYVSRPPEDDQRLGNTVTFHGGGDERGLNDFLQMQRRMRRDTGPGTSSTTTKIPPLDEEREKKIIPKVN